MKMAWTYENGLNAASGSKAITYNRQKLSHSQTDIINQETKHYKLNVFQFMVVIEYNILMDLESSWHKN